MKSLVQYLKEHPLVWLLPLVLFVLVVGGIAWKLANTPDSPFIYDVMD